MNPITKLVFGLILVFGQEYVYATEACNSDFCENVCQGTSAQHNPRYPQQCCADHIWTTCEDAIKKPVEAKTK